MKIIYIPDQRDSEHKLVLQFADFYQVNSMIANGGAYSVNGWNYFFQLPPFYDHTYGNPFTSVEIVLGPEFINFGILYNWWAATDIRGIAPEGWRLPTLNEVWITLTNAAGGQSGLGNKLKEAGTAHWNTGNTATNNYQFSVFGGGSRNASGNFQNLKEYGTYWFSDYYNEIAGAIWWFSKSSSTMGGAAYNSNKKEGFSIRLVKNDSEWTEGDTVSDFDGNIYHTTKIGDQVWMTENFACTHFKNGDPIPLVADTTSWTDDSHTAKMCYYNNERAIAFTSPCIVYLYGGFDITVRGYLFWQNLNLLSVNDYGCIVQLDVYAFSVCSNAVSFVLPILHTAGRMAFYSCTSVPSFNLPELTSIDSMCFAETKCISFYFPKLTNVPLSAWQNCYLPTTFILPCVQRISQYGFLRCFAATTFYLPSLQGFDGPYVWYLIEGNNILLTVPAAMMTINNGQPHPEIQTLMDNNDVTVVQV